MKTPMNSSLSWKVSTHTSSDHQYPQDSLGSAVARLIGLQPGLPISNSALHHPFHWSENELNSLLDIFTADDPSYQSKDLSLLLRRVSWRMRVNSVHNFDAYKKLLLTNPAELPALRKSLSLQVTNFFKDVNFFITLENSVIPKLLRKDRTQPIKGLVTHYGFGEDAYSIAMLLEFIKLKNCLSIPIDIIAWDQNEKMLTLAKPGYYPHLITADLSLQCLNMFFEATLEGYKMSKELQRIVHYEPEHIDLQSINTSLDLLVSSQPLIFRSDEVRIKLIEKFYNKIKPGGFLVLNPLSHSTHLTTLFNVVDLENGIYERPETPTRIHNIAALPSKEPALSHAIDRLENEVHATKEYLSLTLNEYENSHDKLADINHDITSTMNKLVLQKDQIDAERNSLRTMVGSIMHANKELKQQNKQLHATIHHWENIMALCGTGIMLLDAELCVKMFSSDIASIFELKKRDIGRPLSHIDSPFQWNITETASSVFRSRTPAEIEQVSKDDEWYRILISPLIKKDKIEGLVCSFLNITESKRKNEWDQFKASILNQLDDAVIVTNQTGQVTYVNNAAINQFSLHHKKKTGYTIDELYESIWSVQEDHEVILESLEENGAWSGELYYQSPDGKRKRAQTTISTLKDATGQQIGHLNIIRDSFRFQNQDNSSLQRIIEDLTERNDTQSKIQSKT